MTVVMCKKCDFPIVNGGDRGLCQECWEMVSVLEELEEDQFIVEMAEAIDRKRPKWS